MVRTLEAQRGSSNSCRVLCLATEQGRGLNPGHLAPGLCSLTETCCLGDSGHIDPDSPMNRILASAYSPESHIHPGLSNARAQLHSFYFRGQGSLGASGGALGAAWGSQSQSLPRQRGSCGHSRVPGGCDWPSGARPLPRAHEGQEPWPRCMGWKLTSLGVAWWRQVANWAAWPPWRHALASSQPSLPAGTGSFPYAPYLQIHLQKMARDR